MSSPASPIPLWVLLGATASGKTRLAVALAQHMADSHAIPCEILSADSRQVFRGMDIGTGKDLQEYGSLPCHLIDICQPGQEFSVYDFQHHFGVALRAILDRGRQPFLVGGTGLYIDAIVRGYHLQPVPENPELRQQLATCTMDELAARLRHWRPHLHNHTDLDSRERAVRAIEIAEHNAHHPPVTPLPALRPLVMGLRWPRPILRQRITERLHSRLDAGLLPEVQGLLAQGVSMARLAAYGLEYRFACRHLQGELDWPSFVQGLNQAIHQFAKRQETWFRHMERLGVTIHWLEAEQEPLQSAIAFLERQL
ncbi:MAG: tRNA (adenosine(37)-N6)-dimethylallyltransferase MiaA [Magnetococcales bacterium]|nr:tRNA (adenosine(37)-N6)-dimethylallyltransferase MiaA [Magnetococcales bacterium]MBF0116624.1 tRNA (adenosine(37)-N6)-dimethylallyltransferase MiaA [Magnetococcales bacterium]